LSQSFKFQRDITVVVRTLSTIDTKMVDFSLVR
jgi:hypothetical protein